MSKHPFRPVVNGRIREESRPQTPEEMEAELIQRTHIHMGQLPPFRGTYPGPVKVYTGDPSDPIGNEVNVGIDMRHYVALEILKSSITARAMVDRGPYKLGMASGIPANGDERKAMVENSFTMAEEFLRYGHSLKTQQFLDIKESIRTLMEKKEATAADREE